MKKKVARTANQSSQLGLRAARFVATKRRIVAKIATAAPTTATTKTARCRESLATSKLISCLFNREISGFLGFRCSIRANRGRSIDTDGATEV